MKYAILLIIGSLLLAGCATQQTNDTVSVATTFYPLYEATKMVTGDNVQVTSIVPLGTEPHGFEPVPQDIIALNTASAYVTMGIQFEQFEQDLIDSVQPSVKIIAAAQGIELLEADEHDDHGHDDHSDEHTEEKHSDEEHSDEEHADEHDEHNHGGLDPHVWLSPTNMKTMVTTIKDELVALDVTNAQVYTDNAQASIDRLSELDAAYSSGLAECAKDTVLVNHNAFSYLAKDYGFNVVAIAGLSPESEPTPQQIIELVEEAREHDLKYIFYEELVDPRVAETIAAEVGADVLELSPIGAEGQDYFSLMQSNLENLKIALECS